MSGENSNHSILIIDDDMTIRKLMSFHLRNNKYNVFEAESALEAFNVLDTQDVNLVLCDVTMDEMDGYTFCRKVRENDKHRFIPFIFVTAKSSMEDRSRGLEAGGDDFVIKPFDINELLLKINALLKRSAIYKAYGVKKDLESSLVETTPLILIVDDDESLSRLFEFNLKRAGFECRVANDAETGLAIAKEVTPTIIVSDVMMPGMDGFGFRKKLMEDPVLSSVPFIFLTAKSTEEAMLEGYDLGITDYVLKTQGPRLVTAKVSAIVKSLGKERQKVVSALNKAADSLRVKVVPDRAPEFRGFRLDHWHQPYQGIPGGDFLDYFVIDDNNMAVILGDVMGKKWGAWYFAFAYAGYIRSAFRIVLQDIDRFSPASILNKVNKSIYNDAKVSEVFATLSVVLINNKTNTVSYTGAGDLPIIHKSGSTGGIRSIQSKGLLLGFSENGMYEDITFTINKNDSLFLLSDGLTESRNQYGEQFGKVKFNEVLSKINVHNDKIEYIKTELSNFTGGTYEDDISLICIDKI